VILEPAGFIGIDPGVQGGIAVLYIDEDGNERHVTKLPLKDKTEADVSKWLWDLCEGRNSEFVAVIEFVHSSPQMGVKSAFTFGRSYGFLRGCLSSLGFPYVEVRPQAWQKAMGCLTKGDKNVSKAKAQQLYPGEKVTHATADALLLATYARRHHKDLF
jgi:Holliday junction resolvasome RuvABC endonuclease subunit